MRTADQKNQVAGVEVLGVKICDGVSNMQGHEIIFVIHVGKPARALAESFEWFLDCIFGAYDNPGAKVIV